VKGRPYELTSRQRLVVALFCALFLGVGLSIFVSILRNQIYGYWRTRAGTTAEARVIAVKQSYHSMGRGNGSVSTEASYRYEVGGRTFTGSRITLFQPTEHYYPPLKQALDTGRQISVFIDPSEPQFAVIDRDFTWFPFVLAVPFSLAWIAAGLFLGWCIVMNLQGQAIPVSGPRKSPGTVV